MHLIIIMLLNAAELATVITMLCHRLPRRPHFWLKAALCLAAALAYVFFFPLERLGYFGVHLPLIVLSFLYAGLCYELSPLQTVYIGVAGYTVKQIASLLCSIVALLSPGRFSHMETIAPVGAYGYLLIVVIDALVFLLFYTLQARRFGVPELSKNASVQVVLVGLIVIVSNQFWSIGLLTRLGFEYSFTANALAEYLWNLLICVLSLIIQFNIMSISKKDVELDITKKMIAEKERQYKMSKSTMEAINRKCHDLKYQIAALRQGGDRNRHLQEALELVDSFDSAVRTGNETLDLIFTEKNDYCKKHDIAFVCMIEGEKLNFMDVTDLYVMLGNIIDNAINAVRQIPEHSRRSIYVNIHAEKKLLLIQTENPFNGTLEFLDGLPRTNTGDEFNHGFGMSSIRMIAEKYGGSVNTRAEGGVFYLNVVLPIP